MIMLIIVPVKTLADVVRAPKYIIKRNLYSELFPKNGKSSSVFYLPIIMTCTRQNHFSIF